MQSKGGYEEVSDIPTGSTPAGHFVVSIITVIAWFPIQPHNEHCIL